MMTRPVLTSEYARVAVFVALADAGMSGDLALCVCLHTIKQKQESTRAMIRARAFCSGPRPR